MRIVVVDDNEDFAAGMVAALIEAGVQAQKLGPLDVLRIKDGDQLDCDLMLLDMRLGESASGEMLNAAKILPHILTYRPGARVVVFSQGDIEVRECLRCLQFGALSVIPKSAEPSELKLIAEVYREAASPRSVQEQLIEVLWEGANSGGPQIKGLYLEMLVINLFRSMPTFDVLGQNIPTLAGEIDILVENRNEQPFWKKLDSLQIVVECKNRKEPADKDMLNHLAAKVKNRSHLSCVGLMVSMGSITKGFNELRDSIRVTEGVHVFGVHREQLEKWVEHPFDQRETYLRGVLSSQ